MKHWREAPYPHEKPDRPDTYFCGWEIGDTHWHGAAIWNGTSWEPERLPELKGMQPTYFLKRFAGFKHRSKLRYSMQELEDINLLKEEEEAA